MSAREPASAIQAASPPAPEAAAALSIAGSSGRSTADRRGTISIVILAVTAVLLAAAETAAYRWEGRWIVVAAYLWIAWSAFTIAAAAWFTARALWQDLTSRRWLNLICLAATIGFLSWGLGRPENALISNEASQQVGSGLLNAKKENFGYLETAFLGYPSRQYLLTAVPALIGGRSWLNLHLGFLWIYIVGIGVLYAGLRAALRAFDPTFAGYAGLAVLTIYAFPYQLNFARHFEQVSLPSAFVMQAAGWLLLCRERATIVRLLALAWAGAMLAMCYTPGLAAWFLLLTLLALWIIDSLRKRDWRRAIQIGAASLPVLAHGLCFYLMVAPKEPFRIRGSLHPGMTVFVTLQNLFFNFLGDEWWGPPMSFFPVLFALPIVIYLVYAMSGSLGWPHAAIGWWVMGTIFTGVFLLGYTDYPIHFSLQRATVVVPPLVVGGVLAGSYWLAKNGRRVPRAIGRLLVLLVVISVGFNTYRSHAQHQRMVYNLAGELLMDIDAKLKESGVNERSPVTFVLLSSVYEITNPPFFEFAFYRFDNFKLITNDADIPPPDDPGLMGRTVIVYADEGLALPNLLRLLGTRHLEKGTFVVRDRRMDLRRAVFPAGVFGAPARETAPTAEPAKPAE